MKSVRKGIKALVLLAGAFFLFAGCTDLFEECKSYVLTGSISLDSESGDFARSASISDNIDLQSIKISAKLGEKTVEGKMNGQTSYYIELPGVGDWTVEFDYKDKTLYGKITVAITASDLNVSKDVVLSPSFDEGSGAISLKFNDETGLVKGLEYSLKPLGALTDGIFTEDELEALSKTVSNITFPYTLNIEDLPAGSYEVTFGFLNQNGGLLYECQEMITVFSGLTTDSWYGEGAHLSSVGGGVNFTITEDLINSNVDDPVSSSKTVICLADTEDEKYGHKYYLVDDTWDGDALSSDDLVIKSKYIADASTENNWSGFDSKGNFYLLQKTWNDGTYFYSTKEGFSTVTADGLGLESGIDIRVVAVDVVSDALYIFYDPSSNYSVKKYPNLISSNGSDKSVVEFKLSSSELDYESFFVIADGIAYGLSGSTMPTIVKYDLTNVAADFVISKDSSFTVPLSMSEAFSSSSSVKIKDMIYQDGALYILLNERKMKSGNGENDFGFISRGAVLRYDIAFGTIRTIGWADYTKTTSFVWGQTAEDGGRGSEKFCVTPGTDWYLQSGVPMTDFARSLWMNTPSEEYVTGVPSQDNSDTLFYGPQKFLAIKPKKLVIADSGIAFYTDSDIWKYKNVNRILTIDLQEFVVENVKNVSCAFTAKKTDVIVFRGSGYDLEGSHIGSTSVVSGTSGVAGTISGDTYACFPCGDE